ncbi:hypothetical protein MMC29_000686 [Sticta canariensis]|nr:hypothetical protein [Sticta canariensis]
MDARADSQIYSGHSAHPGHPARSGHPGQAPPTSTAATSPTDSAHHARSASGKKRRTSTAGSRGVANLTPDQLAKKRANDREAQRAIRERTKGQIETLEQRIRELTSQQPYQDLQHVIRQKEIVEAENEDIKRRLASVLSIIQPLLGEQALSDLTQPIYRDPATAEANYSPRREVPLQQIQTIQAPNAHYPDAPSIRSATSTSSTYTSSPQGPRQTPPNPPPTMFASQPGPFSPVNAFDRQRNIITHGLDLRTSGEKLDLGFLLDNRHQIRDGRQHLETWKGIPSGIAYPQMSAGAASASSHVQNGKVGDVFETPLLAQTTPVRNIAPTCPLDGLLLEFLAERQQRAAEGIPSQKLVGPAYPSVSSLLNPERSIYSHPLSKVFTDILLTFPDLSALPEQVAVLYIMFLIMRWQISPTQETYDRLPEWVTPRPSQLFTPHPAWVDHLPWPRMRDRMVHLYPNIALENFFIPYTTTLSLNWPYDPSDTLLSLPDSDELSINPVFERHLRDLNNWTLGPAFAKAFPMLAETTKIKPDVGGRINS